MSYKADYEKKSRKQMYNTNGQDMDVQLDEFHRDWYPVFQRFQPDSNGEVRVADLRRYLHSPDVQNILPKHSVNALLRWADKDRNNRISYYEFLHMVRGTGYQQKHGSIIRRAVAAAAATVVPKNERKYLDQHTCCPPPFFILLISIAEIAIFIYHTLELVEKKGWIGINGPVPFDSVLIYNPRKRHEAWRFVSYMLVHSGIMHISFNILMQLVIGIPLEMVHKWWRVMIVYISGVIAGSLATSITDPHIFLAGASGGVYALIFAHLASMILNWTEMEFAWLRLISFSILTIGDVGVAVYYRLIQQQDTKVAYVAHIAGAVAGLLIGINVLRNLRKQIWEQVIWWLSLLTFVGLIGTAIAWNIHPFFEL